VRALLEGAFPALRVYVIDMVPRVNSDYLSM
jgi:hypothetical protein